MNVKDMMYARELIAGPQQDGTCLCVILLIKQLHLTDQNRLLLPDIDYLEAFLANSLYACAKTSALASIPCKWLQAMFEHKEIRGNAGQACGSHPCGHLVADYGSQSPVWFQWQLLPLWSPSVTSR